MQLYWWSLLIQLQAELNDLTERFIVLYELQPIALDNYIFIASDYQIEEILNMSLFAPLKSFEI